jgi:hypothetical protein
LRAPRRRIRYGDALSQRFAAHMVALFARVDTFLALGLTKPNHRFPGRFRGCHPLVVGIHTVPDYRVFLAEAVHD